MLPKKFSAWALTLAIFPLVTVPAAAATVIITKADCAALVRHVAEPGVAYEPGVDVNGRPVVSADLGDRPEIKLPEEIVIAITVDIDKRFDIPQTPDLFRPEAFRSLLHPGFPRPARPPLLLIAPLHKV